MKAASSARTPTASPTTWCLHRQVAVGTLEKVHVFGNDYPTPDGTGVRDYIHVVDLARGHVAALKKLASNCGLFICNLGTGKGYSVLDVIKAYSKACGKDLPYVIDPRRPGDIAECYADPAKPGTSWAGRPNTTWPACARTAGAGSPRTPTATGTRNRRRSFSCPFLAELALCEDNNFDLLEFARRSIIVRIR